MKKSDWQRKKLDEVYWFQEGPGVRKWQFHKSGIKLVNVSNITKEGVLDLSKTDRHLSKEEVEEKYQHFLIDAGDFVIASSGISIEVDGFLRTRGVFVDESHLPLVMNTSTIRFKEVEGISTLKYLKYWLDSFEFREQITRLVTGSAQKNFGPSHLKKLSISLPPLEYQRFAADILDRADALRTARRKSIEKLDQLLQSVFLDMFGSPNESPYEIMTLNDVCEVITDGAHHTPTYVEKGVPFLRVTDIQDEVINFSKTKYIPQHEHQSLIKRCHPQIGDVLYSKNGTIGIPKIVDWQKEFSIFVSLALLRPKADILLSGYLESFLFTPFALRQAMKHSKTGTVTNLHLVEIRKVKMPIPPVSIQQNWLDKKAEIKKRINTLRRSQKKLDNFFNSLQQRAFRGELTSSSLAELDKLTSQDM